LGLRRPLREEKRETMRHRLKTQTLSSAKKFPDPRIEIIGMIHA
jgi:hypothetical protein